jgi:class 3 adenylate cyclase
MARTIAERISQAAERSFVGRRGEVEMLRDAILADEPPFVAAYVHGPGGIGKSRFVKATLDAVSPPARALVLDCGQIEPTPRGFLRAVAAALEEDAHEPDLDGVARMLGDCGPRTVLALDTYETFGLMDAWLRQTFLPILPDTVMTLMAGRNAPSAAWLTTPGWEGLFRDVELRSLDPDDALRLLEQRGLGEEQAARVNRFARGHPLALELAAAALRTQPDLDIAPGPPPKILPQLTAAFLAGLPARTAEAVEAASTVRRVTEPALAALLGAPTGADRFDDIRELPFVEMTAEGLALHDVVRDTIAQDLARRDPERHRRYLLRAWRFLNCESHLTATLDLWRHTADLIFLIQSPFVREGFFPAGSSEVRVEPATPSDAEAILGIVAETAPEELGLLQAWWDGLPDAFHVARDGAGTIIGFYLLFEAGVADPALADADPLTRAWLDHLRREPVAEGERVLFLRRWLVRGTGELPSPAQGACWLDVKRTYMEMRPDLRRIYTAVQALDVYAPAVTPLGFVPVPEADVLVGGATLHTAMLDFGDSSVDGWLRRLVGAEVGAEADEDGDIDGGLPEGTVTIMFADIADSTGLTERLGDAAFRSLARTLDGSMRVIIAETGGVPVEGKLLGDGLMAVFASARQAIDCGVRVNAAADATAFGLHLGLHAGDVIREDGNVFGGAVNIAARVAALASPGEVLVSETVRSLARTSANVTFESRGLRALKGVEDPHWLYAIVAAPDRSDR